MALTMQTADLLRPYRAIHDPITGELLASALTGPRAIPVHDKGGKEYNLRAMGGACNFDPDALTGTDDTEAIFNALDEIWQENGPAGGRLIIPRPTLVATRTSSGGLGWCVPLMHDGLEIVGNGRQSLLYNGTTPPGGGANGTATFLVSGAAKAGGGTGTLWSSNTWFGTAGVYTNALPVYEIDPVSKYVTTITLTIPADAANFAAEDWIAIQTGQTISGFNNQPDAEVNRIKSINPATGEIVLMWPTSKPYAQEYYLSGTSGVTSTDDGGGTRTAARFGISNITNNILHNCALRNLRIISTGEWYICDGGQTSNFTYDNLVVENLGRGLDTIGLGNIGKRITNCRVRVFDALEGRWFWSADTGSTFFTVADNIFTADNIFSFHIHEGSANGLVARNRSSVSYTTADQNMVSIRGRAYDLIITENTLIGGGVTSVYVDASCSGGGIIGPNIIRARSSPLGNAMNIDASGWHVAPQVTEQPISLFAANNSNIVGPLVREHLSGWVADNLTNPSLGTLPRHTIVTSVRVYVQEAFNSDGTNQITVGFDGTVSAFATAVDVSTTGVKTVTLGAQAGVYQSTERAVEAYYTAGGSAPTTGRALIVVEYERVARQVA